MPSTTTSRTAAWPLERVLFTMAGTITFVGALLALLVSPWFALVPAFVGANQLLYAAAGACPASIILERAFGVQRGCRR
jgi:hypothetical protein